MRPKADTGVEKFVPDAALKHPLVAINPREVGRITRLLRNMPRKQASGVVNVIVVGFIVRVWMRNDARKERSKYRSLGIKTICPRIQLYIP
jgi:hypothetical protein